MRRVLHLIIGPDWQDHRQPGFWLLPLAVLALAVRFIQFVRPFEWFVSVFPADDFYYYANTAWHLAQGHGSTFDGGVSFHNGYHPLFMWMLVPGYALGIDKAAMVKVAMGILSLASLAMIFLAYHVGRRLGAGWGSLVIPLVIAFGGYFVHQSLWGFEAPLATAFVLAVILAVLQERPAVTIGVLLGLAVLARIDNGILALPLGLHLWRSRGWRDAALTAAVAFLVVLPWAAWSVARFGTPLPVSGVLKSSFGDLGAAVAGFVVFAREWGLMVLGDLSKLLMPAFVPVLVGIAALAAGVWASRSRPWLIAYVLLSVLGFAILTSTRDHVQFMRYCSSAVVVLGILVFSVRWPRPRVWLTLVAVLVAVGGLKYVRWFLVTPERSSYKAACQQQLPGILENVAGPDDLVGSFDSGAAGYYCSRPVVNLDGLVNAEVVAMLGADEDIGWDRRYRRYLAEKGITILVGAEGYAWTNYLPDYADWTRLYEPIPTDDGGDLLILRVPASIGVDH